MRQKQDLVKRISELADRETLGVLVAVLTELRRAESKHPLWPADPIHAVAILAEECGEAVKESLDLAYHTGSLDRLETELVQCGAMSLRCLIHKDSYVYPEIKQ